MLWATGRSLHSKGLWSRTSQRVEFWSRFCEIVAPGPLDECLATVYAHFEEWLLPLLLNHKAARRLLKSVAADDAFTDAAAQFPMLTVAAATYNEAVATANALIDARRAATGAADIKTIETTLASLRLTIKRWEPKITTACEEYQAAVEEKAQIEEQKTATKIKLDEYTEDCPQQVRAGDQPPTW